MKGERESHPLPSDIHLHTLRRLRYMSGLSYEPWWTMLLSSHSAWTNASDCPTHELFESTDIHDKDVRLTTCNFGRFIDGCVFSDRQGLSHLHCHCVLCSAHLTVVCRSQTPASPCGIVVFKPRQNEYTYTWLGSMSRMFFLAEDPLDSQLHLQCIWVPRQLKWMPVNFITKPE